VTKPDGKMTIGAQLLKKAAKRQLPFLTSDTEW
jgi:hypothetical protein